MEGSTTEASPETPPPTGNAVRAVPPWFKVFPFVISALFFFSFVFAIFSPIPLLILYSRTDLRRLGLAILTNTLLAGVLGGATSAALYFVFVGLLSLLLPYFLFHRKWMPDRTILATLVVMVLAGAGLVVGYFLLQHQAPGPAVHRALQEAVDKVIEVSGTNQGSVGDIPVEELKENMMTEFPSLVVVFGLLMAWVNTLILVRMQPVRVREQLGIDHTYFKKWKAPEWLIWPAIAVGCALIFTKGVANTVALNAFKFLMVVYGLQGLSILVYVLDMLRIRGFIRTFIYLISTLFMTPVLIGFGFFDLWFDFRSKIRQS